VLKTPKSLMTERELSSRLHISVAWLQRQRWLKLGPPYIRLRRAVRYDADAVERWLETQIVSPSVKGPQT
jgi:predicted DNA-binding transcriptional regulator AlpA